MLIPRHAVLTATTVAVAEIVVTMGAGRRILLVAAYDSRGFDYLAN